VTKGGAKHSILFDTGPEGDVWERNAERLKLNLSTIEHIHLSHWHPDHSGGMLSAIRKINASKEPNAKVTVGLHPNRPEYRGSIGPLGKPISLQADPTFEEIEGAGANVVKSSEAYTILEDTFLVSGEIPRVTTYEIGMPRGVRFVKANGAWEPDPLIMDERLVMVNLKGRSSKLGAI
jgi:7,8-dihydropterin-6-yl-methyl-4-(beta-D-ribofuranosyl)aminobenzene 5'-phosphate synthase